MRKSWRKREADRVRARGEYGASLATVATLKDLMNAHRVADTGFLRGIVSSIADKCAEGLVRCVEQPVDLGELERLVGIERPSLENFMGEAVFGLTPYNESSSDPDSGGY